METPEAPRTKPPHAGTALPAPAIRPGGPDWGPRSRPGWRRWAAGAPKPHQRSAGPAGSCSSAQGSGPNGGSQPSGPGLARVSWPRGRPRLSFLELMAYLLAPAAAAAAALRSGEAAAGAPVASRSRGGLGREAPVAKNRWDGKRKALGIYNQNVG